VSFVIIFATLSFRDTTTGADDTELLAGWTVIGEGSPYSTAERRVPELIPVLGSQPAGDVSHIPGWTVQFVCGI